MPKPAVNFTPGQRAWLDAQRTEEHTVAVTGQVTKVEELPPETDDDGNQITPARVLLTVSGDNGTATFEAVPPLTPEEREAQEATQVAEAQAQAEAAAAERDAEVERAQAEEAERVRTERQQMVDELLTKQREAQAAFEERVVQMVAAEVEKRMPGTSGSTPATS